MFGVGRGPDGVPPGELDVVPCGESLLSVLHEHLADHHDRLSRQLRSPSNRGAGSVDREDVEEARGFVALIEDLRKSSVETAWN